MTRDETFGYFKVQEFFKYDARPSKKTIGKVIRMIKILNPIRSKLKQPITIQAGSRSKDHELSRGRLGTSQHVYSNGLGAADITTVSEEKLEELYELLLAEPRIKRVCIYRHKGFVHIDFKQSSHKKYIADIVTNVWQRV